MAKVKHNNFLDTVDEVITNATNAGVIHLRATGDALNGRHITINGHSAYHFGTTGYLGLEQDRRLKNAAKDAIEKYGTQFPLSKTYISHPLYAPLEEKISEMYGYPILITKNSTLGHLAVIPTAVRYGDAVILDHQVHWSVQSATEILKSKGITVRMIRHSNMEMLEHTIKALRNKAKKIWYMADGVYSMYGDFSPLQDLMVLSKKYPQLHLYIDDVHGMSWKGPHGTGYAMSVLKELPPNILLFGTLSKTFGASGAVLVCPDKKLHQKIKNFGGPLTFSAQLEPSSVAAAIASAEIHLSDEIYTLQQDLLNRINFFNSELAKTDLPLIKRNDSPVFYIGTGMPITGYNFVNRLMKEGFFVNLGIFPAVPIKNTGIRITISRHNQKKEIKALVEAMVHHFPKALADTFTNNDRVRKAFNLSKKPLHTAIEYESEALSVQTERSISSIEKSLWNSFFANHGVFDWNGLQFLEQTFSENQKPEENWEFYYFIIRDQLGKPVIATYFTYALWKEDMLAPASVSQNIENIRLEHPYHMTSYVLAMGSLFTEGSHLYLDNNHPMWQDAMHRLFKELEKLDDLLNPSMIVLRDFDNVEILNEFFHNHGYFKVSMPEAGMIENLQWTGVENYLSSLSSKSRRHFKNDIAPFEAHFEVEILNKIPSNQVEKFYMLFENVRKNNLGLNTFGFPKHIIQLMSSSDEWEFIVLILKASFVDTKKDIPVGVMFCYKNEGKTYVPAFVGMDYNYAFKHQVYRQLLFQTVKRAGELGFQTIDFGLTAGFEKRKIGAEIREKSAYIQAKDNFSLELLEMMDAKK